MNQSFDSVVLGIIETITIQSHTPSSLVTALQESLQKAELYENEWFTDLYESQDFDPYIH